MTKIPEKRFSLMCQPHVQRELAAAAHTIGGVPAMSCGVHGFHIPVSIGGDGQRRQVFIPITSVSCWIAMEAVAEIIEKQTELPITDQRIIM